jgi:hypothetical protein
MRNLVRILVRTLWISEASQVMVVMELG